MDFVLFVLKYSTAIVVSILAVLYFFINIVGREDISVVNLVMYAGHEIFTNHTYRPGVKRSVAVNGGYEYRVCNCGKVVKVINK